jgi:hypothetical protein
MKPASLLRWYPRAWRERYGEELLALIQDNLDEGRPAWPLQLSMIWGGLGERGRQARHAAKAAFQRPGRSDKGVTILAAGLICGFGLGGLTPPSSAARAWQAVALDAVLAAVALTGALVLADGLVALPALVRFLRAGGWPKIRRRVGWAAGATAAAGGGLVFVWGSDWQTSRNVSWATLAGLLVTGLAMTGAIGLWSATATATARHLTLAPRVRAAQLMLGAVLPTAVRAMVATCCLWWAAILPSSITLLVLSLVNLALVIVLAPGRIGRAVRLSRRLRSAASGATIINPSAQRTHGRHRA